MAESELLGNTANMLGSCAEDSEANNEIPSPPKKKKTTEKCQFTNFCSMESAIVQEIREVSIFQS